MFRIEQHGGEGSACTSQQEACWLAPCVSSLLSSVDTSKSPLSVAECVNDFLSVTEALGSACTYPVSAKIRSSPLPCDQKRDKWYR